MSDSIKIFLEYSSKSKRISKPFIIMLPETLEKGTYAIEKIEGDILDEGTAVEEYLLKRKS